MTPVVVQLDSMVGSIGEAVKELVDLKEGLEPKLDRMKMAAAVTPSESEGPCPVCGGTGIFGANEKWLYLVFAGLGFLMGYLAMVHGRQ